MFCHRLYKWRTSQYKSLHNTQFQPVRQIDSGEMPATLVDADSRSTTSTIKCNEMLGGMFSSCNIHLLSLQVSMNVLPVQRSELFQISQTFSVHLLENFLYKQSKVILLEANSGMKREAFYFHSGFEPMGKKGLLA